MSIRSVRRALVMFGAALCVLFCCGVSPAPAGAGIEVYVNGDRVVFPDERPFIAAGSGRTYVPLRFVSEALGAAVDWDGGIKTAVINTRGKGIRMPVNSRTAIVDGAGVALDAPAVLVAGRTMVPLRFVSEVLGARVDWFPPSGGQDGRVMVTLAADAPEPDEPAPDRPDEGNAGDDQGVPDGPWTLKADEADGRTKLRIESPVPFTHNVFAMTGPDRLVIDLTGVGADVPADVVLDFTAVAGLRTGFSDHPPTGRVVCDLAAGLGFTRYRVEAGADRCSLSVEIWTVDSPLEDRVIVLDPGHGGADPGAIGPSGLREKDVNLALAQVVAPLLQREGARVVLTRTDDVRLGANTGEDLAARSRFANAQRADLFISLHANAALSREAQGTSVYYHAHAVNGAENVKLARALQASLVRALGRRDLGALSCNFYVLRHIAMPGVLVELAFISNPEEEQLLAQPRFRERAAAAIVDGVRDYYGALGV